MKRRFSAWGVSAWLVVLQSTHFTQYPLYGMGDPRASCYDDVDASKLFMNSIVLIEDNLPLQKVMEFLLAANGYAVAPFASGPPALEIIAASPPDLILCDIALQGMDGYEILRRVREMKVGIEIPFLFLSALTERDHVRKGMDLGADDYLTKPISSASLLAAVRARIDRSISLQDLVEHKFQEYQKQKLLSLPHEVLTPLNGILGGVAILREEIDNRDAGVRECLEIIESSAERLEKTLLKYLYYLELKSGLFPICKRRTDVDAGLVVASVSTKMAREEEREGDLVLHTQEVCVPCGECLENVLAEVVSNAFKFSAAGSKVEVRMATEPERVRITCRDEGVGMTEEEIAAIGPFVQFHRKRREQQGLGLGLAICRELVKCEGCSFQIRPAEPGLIVELSLPGNAATR